MTAAVIGPTSRQARAVLHHPDQRTPWTIVVGARSRTTLVDLDARLDELRASLPVVGARLDGDWWVAGEGPSPTAVGSDAVAAIASAPAFDLAREPPLRVVVTADGRDFAVGAHHAAFDGLTAVAIAGFVAGGPAPTAGPDARSARRGRLAPLARRVLQPADRIAPSGGAGAREVLAVRAVHLAGPDVTARIAAAAAGAAAAHNRRRAAPWRRVGVSIGMGGPHAGGNAATYRRIDVRADADVRAATTAALRIEGEPTELVAPSRVLRLARPLVSRLSDSFLVSNVGRHDLGGLEQLTFFPVARGRSAVAFGAVGLRDGPSSLTIRARDLTPDDAAAILDATVARLEHP